MTQTMQAWFAVPGPEPVLDRAFPFDRLADAHAYMLSDAQTGKIVLSVAGDR